MQAPIQNQPGQDLIDAARELLDHHERSKVMLREQVEPDFLSRMYRELMAKVLRGKEKSTPERLVAFIRQGLRRAAGYR